MLARSVRPQSVRLRSDSAVRNGSGTLLPRVSVLRHCTSADAPNPPKQQPPKAPPKTKLVSIAGDLHLRIDAINVHVHLMASNLLQAGQQDLATTVQSAVMGAAASAAAAHLVAPSGEPAPIARASTFTCINEFSPLVRALAMCSDGHRFLCGYDDSNVALWDLRKPGQRVVADIRKFTIQSVAASADCGRVLVGGEHGLWLWDVEQGKVTALLDDDSEEDQQHKDVWRVAITPDGRYGVSGGYDQGVRVWDLRKGECIGREATVGPAVDVVISPDGQTATAVVRFVDGSENDSEDDSEDDLVVGGYQVWRWHAGSGFCKPVTLQGCDQGLCRMSADGGVVLVVDDEGVVQQWDGQSGKREAAFSTQAGEVSCLALSCDARRAVLGSEEGVLSVWDVEGKACLANLPGHGGSGFTQLSMSADGRYVVCYSYSDDRLCVWHLG